MIRKGGTDPKTKREVLIDIVGKPVSGKKYLIGSCKCRNEVIGLDELELLKEYANVFGKGSKYHYILFSKSGFTKGLTEYAQKNNVILRTLSDLYKD